MCFRMYSQLVFVFCAILSSINAYKHIIMIHGLKGDPEEFDLMLQWLEKDHPGTNYTVLNEFNHRESFDPLWFQIYVMAKKVRQIMMENPKGVHIIGYSQGGVLSRGLIESIPNHNFKNFISLSSPQGGQYGDTGFITHFPYLIKKEAYHFFYTKKGQQWSVGNYWNDPHHQDDYLSANEFLPLLNNMVKSNFSHIFKRNILSMDNLVLIGGPDDGIIEPWQSSQFGFFDNNETVQPLEKQTWYTNDTFGLKTLDYSNRLHRITVQNVKHHFWPRNHTIWREHILPWLT